MNVVVVGDVLLDRDLHGDVTRLCPDAPVPVVDRRHTRERPGGAGLAALVAGRLGAEVTLVTSLADDDTGAEVRRLLDRAGVDVLALHDRGETAEKLRVRTADRTLVRIDRGRAGPIDVDPATDRAVTEALAAADAVVVEDYGRGTTAHSRVREWLGTVTRRRPTVWDPHPRGAPPVAGSWLLTPNEHELGSAGGSLAATTDAARRLRARHDARGVAATLGARGALLVTGDGPPLLAPCDHTVTGDVSGAGDAFAVGAALALGRGAVHSEAVAEGVAAGARFVGSLHATTWTHEPDGADERRPPAARDDHRGVGDLIAATRARGGTVVMTGGCFDLIHRGHIQLLRQARALGDCLVVCLNSDASVRRLKGPARPVVSAADRAGVLRALEAVDDVVVFDEDTPVEVLRRHRPDVFVKGGDYHGRDLPEAEALADWGGDVVIVPFLDGHSTTRLLQEARHER